MKRLIGITALGGALLLFFAFGIRSFFLILEGKPITQSTGFVRALAEGLLSAMVLMLLFFGYLAWGWLEAGDWVWLDLFENPFRSRKRRQEGSGDRLHYASKITPSDASLCANSSRPTSTIYQSQ